MYGSPCIPARFGLYQKVSRAGADPIMCDAHLTRKSAQDFLVKWHVEAAEPTVDTDNLVRDPGISDTKWASTVSLAPLAVSNGGQEPCFDRTL